MADTSINLPIHALPVLDQGGHFTLAWYRAFQNFSTGVASGITQLTGPVTAIGPGVAVTAITPTGVVPGSYTSADLTIGADGRVTAAADGSASSEVSPLNLLSISMLDGAFNVASADILYHSRSISIAGDGTWSVNFNGSTNVSSALTLAVVNANVGTFGDATHVGQFTVNAKGLITAAANVAFPPSVPYAPLTTGAEPIMLISDGIGQCVMVPFTP